MKHHRSLQSTVTKNWFLSPERIAEECTQDKSDEPMLTNSIMTTGTGHKTPTPPKFEKAGNLNAVHRILALDRNTETPWTGALSKE